MRRNLEKSLNSHAINKWIPRLTIKEKRAIEEYTGMKVYETINQVLREDSYYASSNDIQQLIDNIDSGLRKFKYGEVFPVYRAVSEQEYNFIKSSNSIEIFTGFKSTTISQNIAEELAELPTKHIIMAHLPRNVNGAYIAPLSVFAEEKEFLLNRDCEYQVIRSFHDIERDIKYIFLKVVS